MPASADLCRAEAVMTGSPEQGQRVAGSECQEHCWGGPAAGRGSELEHVGGGARHPPVCGSQQCNLGRRGEGPRNHGRTSALVVSHAHG